MLLDPSPRRALVLGGAGMLAREVAPALAHQGWSATLVPRAACDIADPAQLDALLARERAALVVNCAAYTAVDRAEDDPARAFAVNAEGAGHVARAAARHGAALLHLSTDYVFDGTQRTPYRETDGAAPLGAYARSKWAGEQAIAAVTGVRAWVVRTGELYGDGGPSFFRAIFRAARAGRPLRVVRDQVVSPTWTRELAAQLAVLVASDAPPGVYHATAAGETSWYDAAVFALRRAGLDAPVEPVTTAEYGSRTPRPPYSVLAPAALAALGLYRMRAWDAALVSWLEGPRGLET